MAGYTLYTGGPYKQINGSAITATSTIIDKGTAKNVPDGENLTRSDWRTGNPEVPAFIPTNDAGATAYTKIEDGLADSNTVSGDYLVITVADSSIYTVNQPLKLVAGAYTPLELFVRVISIIDATDIKVSCPANGTEAANGDMEVYEVTDNFNVYAVPEIRTVTTRTPSDFGRSKVHYMRSARVVKVTTAIRLGRYNIYTGTFLVAPSTANDYTSLDVDGTNVPDNESKSLSGKREVGGAFSINAGGRTVQTKDYEAKTG